jgi:flagellar protein FlaG
MGIAITGVGAGYAQPELVGDQATHRTGHPQSAEARPREAAPVDIDQTVKDIERISLAFNKKLRFTVDSRLEEVIVKVIDPETDKVIKELPPEELQRLHLRLKEMIGLLFDEIV